MLTQEDLQAIKGILREEVDSLREEIKLDRVGNTGEHEYLNKQLEQIDGKLDKVMAATHADILDRFDARLYALEETVKKLTA